MAADLDAPMLRQLADDIRAAVPSAVGGYLHGSTGRRRLRPQSDLDLLVLTEAPLSASERARLTGVLLEASGRYPRSPTGPRPIELTVVVRSEVQPWRFPPRCELQYGEWLRREVEAGHALEPFASPDLAIVLRMVLDCDAPVFGPPPADVLDPVPPADVIRATTEAVPELLAELDHDTANVLLTLARAWRTATTGAVVGKDEAATWAGERSPAAVRDVLDRARTSYVDGTGHRWGSVDDGTREAARFLASSAVGDRRAGRTDRKGTG